MNSTILLENIDSNNTSISSNSNDAAITATSRLQPHVYRYSGGVQLLDNVTNSVISVDKWIAQELDRLSHNHSPRNCSNYEALLSVVEGYYYTEPYITLGHNFSSPQQQGQCHDAYYEDGNQSTPRFPLSPSSSSGILNDAISLNCHQPPRTTINNDQLTQRNLTLAYTKLIQLCQSQFLHQFYIKHHRRPLELLIELEKMCELITWSSRTTVTTQQKITEENLSLLLAPDTTHDCQKKLGHILFGTNIPIVNSLVNAWTIICLWVQQDTSTPSKQQKWIIFGVYSYQMAKKLCGIDYHQQQQHINNKKNVKD